MPYFRSAIPQRDSAGRRGAEFRALLQHQTLGRIERTGLGLAIVHGVMKSMALRRRHQRTRPGHDLHPVLPTPPAEERVDAPHTPTPLPLVGLPSCWWMILPSFAYRAAGSRAPWIPGRDPGEREGSLPAVCACGGHGQKSVRPRHPGHEPARRRDGLEIFELIRQLFPSQRALLVRRACAQ